MGASEPEVKKYFYDRVFPDPGPEDSLQLCERQPMARSMVPNASSKLKVSTPVPDLLYGYNRSQGFRQQQTQLISMGSEMMGTNQPRSLIYPFFLVEFKGDGGMMWVATNQCLGGAATCVSIAERLNDHLRNCNSNEIRVVDSAAFSIAMNHAYAQVYISWRHGESEYNMAQIRSFLLQDPEHYIDFRRMVRNILDWGRDERLTDIRTSLDKLLEEGRKQTSAAAKYRQPPLDNSGANGSKKPRPSSRSDGGRSKRGQGQGDGASDSSHWESASATSREAFEGVWTPQPQISSINNAGYATRAGWQPVLAPQESRDYQLQGKGQAVSASFTSFPGPQGAFASSGFDPPESHEAASKESVG
ncbi:hypothetical protein VTK26DRAFT_5650 [Humicola hyalothermophila]